MPGGDRTGPMGQGPRTGRGAGYCSGFSIPGFINALGGGGMRGRGRGRGGGRGWRNMFYATGLTAWQRAAAASSSPACTAAPARPAPAEFTEKEELDELKAQVGQAAATLEQIRERINEIASARSQEVTE